MDSLQVDLSAYVLALADDELILGHRASQWCGHAPILEEDIAFANLALDEIGHAGLWYGLYADLTGQDPETTPDRLVYRRPAREFRCAPLVELPNGDWAFSMLRQYCFDCAEVVRLSRLAESSHPHLAAIAEKVAKEEQYHLRHTQAWVERLGRGSAESHRRMQAALTALWPYLPGLFRHAENEQDLAAAGTIPPADLVRDGWQGLALPLLSACKLALPKASPESRSEGSKERGEHHGSFAALIAELQSVSRQDPQAEW